MNIGTAILIIGFAALAAAFFLLLISLVYYGVMYSKMPPGIANPGKLHAVHCGTVAVAVGGRILERLGLCSQLRFTRWCTDRIMGHKHPYSPGLHVKDLNFSGVPVRVYEPTTVSNQKRRGLMYFHGGGWVLGSIDLYDEICRHISKESDTVVVSVGYRLAPEHRFPAPLDDCESATKYFLSIAREFGVNPYRVALGGDSAGGNLAAALSQRLANSQEKHLPSPCGLVLIYPALQMADFNLPSYQQNHAVPLLYRAQMVFFYLQYLNVDMSVCEDVMNGKHVPTELKLHYRKWLDPANLPPEFQNDSQKQVVTTHVGEVYQIVKGGLVPEISPLLAEDNVLRLTPYTFILTCQYDVLRDDGILFYKRLKDLGVKVTWYNVPDGFHGVLNFFGKDFPSGAKAMEHIVSFLKTL